MRKDTFDALIFSKSFRCVLDDDINGYCYGLEEGQHGIESLFMVLLS